MAICKIGDLFLRHFSIVFNGTTATVVGTAANLKILELQQI